MNPLLNRAGGSPKHPAAYHHGNKRENNEVISKTADLSCRKLERGYFMHAFLVISRLAPCGSGLA